MTDTSYNGWTNRDTWAVNLHWGDYWAARAEDGETLTAEGMESDVDAYLEEALASMPEGQRLFIYDMMLFDVNWQELARHFETESA
tara:strand:- start:1565 stop:1822 length:258 start_codon:yes stop_codon:yes gene_type:complete